MPVATVPTYAEMWAHPQVVAALSNGLYTYTDVPAWDQTLAYARGANVLSCDEPYGYVYTATAAIPAGSAGPGDNPAWTLNHQLTQERLVLFTATTQATWLLDTLTGYRLHGAECWQEDYEVWTCTIRLRRSPVTHVNAVTRITPCTAGEGTVNWCRTGAQTISLCQGMNQPYPWPPSRAGGCGGDIVRVYYSIASNLPPGTEALVAWLAEQYGKAAQGTACALPERVQSVTRQGVSWTILDPQDYLTQGRTGMARVDAWLAAVGKTLGGTLIDPLTSSVRFSEQVDCPHVEPV